MAQRRMLPQGIFAPVPCFFLEKSEDIDFVAFKKHIQYISKNGTLPVISGTMGEAPHLSREERMELIKAAREALDAVELKDIPIIAGIGATSTRESIKIAEEASTAGADFAIAIAPGYYAGALTANMESIRNYFVDIAAASPIPVMMYNFPGVTSGIDLDSDLIIDVAKSAPNICGVKLTCGNVGKLTRVTAVVESESFKKDFPRKEQTAPFRVIDGFIDFLLPSISSKTSGAITGLANFAPKSCAKLWELCQLYDKTGDPTAYKQAKELQNIISAADGVAIIMGISGMKMLLNRLFGYGRNPRLPIMPMGKDTGSAFYSRSELRTLLELEISLK